MNLIFHVLRAVLIFLLLIFGLVGALVGYIDFRSMWPDVPLLTAAYYCLSFVGGVAMFVLGAVLLFTRRVTLRWLAFAAAAVLFLNQTVGVWLNAMLCFSPG